MAWNSWGGGGSALTTQEIPASVQDQYPVTSENTPWYADYVRNYSSNTGQLPPGTQWYPQYAFYSTGYIPGQTQADSPYSLGTPSWSNDTSTSSSTTDTNPYSTDQPKNDLVQEVKQSLQGAYSDSKANQWGWTSTGHSTYDLYRDPIDYNGKTVYYGDPLYSDALKSKFGTGAGSPTAGWNYGTNW